MSNPTVNPQQNPQLAHIKANTQRQRIARNHGISVETVRRWVRFAEKYCFDWHECNPTGKTPRFLHPYQVSILQWILNNRECGKAWLETALLNDKRLTFDAWLTCQQSAA